MSESPYPDPSIGIRAKDVDRSDSTLAFCIAQIWSSCLSPSLVLSLHHRRRRKGWNLSHCTRSEATERQLLPHVHALLYAVHTDVKVPLSKMVTSDEKMEEPSFASTLKPPHPSNAVQAAGERERTAGTNPARDCFTSGPCQ
ncbi:hypothetical protein MRB53_021350 [Persea americana]|uniref:Uncharacterized protein n=1 Tax=Persea americana TaxID=3435 RepID=A0ACC2L444_PERAE|nr:hypothetical protein MRB53_021350 [Persea americana]